MNGSVHDWVHAVLLAEDVHGMSVAEAGSFDVNGSVRRYVESLEPESYLGIDIRNGPGVDRLADAADLPSLGTFGLVISTEMLEHAQDWRAAMAGLVHAVAPGGLLVVTARSPGFPYHGYPDDHWRFGTGDMRLILERAGMEVLDLRDDPSMPGVFAKARKPQPWAFPESPWDGITLDSPDRSSE